jgi:hypothetical protein
MNENTVKSKIEQFEEFKFELENLLDQKKGELRGLEEKITKLKSESEQAGLEETLNELQENINKKEKDLLNITNRVEEERSTHKFIDLPLWFRAGKKNLILVAYILTFSLLYVFLSSDSAITALYSIFLDIENVENTLLVEYRNYFQSIVTTLTIGTIFLMFLPREKLDNARKGLIKFESLDFKKFLTKFHEVHGQIQETEKNGSDYSKILAIRNITNAVKTQEELGNREKNAKCIWVASSTLENDVKDEILKDVVLPKIKDNVVEYIWIIPPQPMARENADIIKNSIKELGDKIKGSCKIIEAGNDAKWLLNNDVIVYDYPEETSVWESTFESRYLNLPSDNNKSIHHALKSIINSAETGERSNDNKKNNLIVFQV